METRSERRARSLCDFALFANTLAFSRATAAIPRSECLLRTLMRTDETLSGSDSSLVFRGKLRRKFAAVVSKKSVPLPAGRSSARNERRRLGNRWGRVGMLARSRQILNNRLHPRASPPPSPLPRPSPRSRAARGGIAGHYAFIKNGIAFLHSRDSR